MVGDHLWRSEVAGSKGNSNPTTFRRASVVLDKEPLPPNLD
jgi:hypothetical protein